MIEELTRGAGELQEFLAQVEDLGREGFPYLDAARARTESQFRECIRRTFGEKSAEFQEHRHHKLLMDSPETTRQSIDLIKTLIARLEQKNCELQGRPSSQHLSPTPVALPMSTRPLLTVVPASISTVQMPEIQTVPIAPPPVVMAVAMTANLDLSPSMTALSPPLPPPAPFVSLRPAEPLSPCTSLPESVPISPAPAAIVMPHTPPQPVDRGAPEPQPAPLQVAQIAQEHASHDGKRLEPSQPEAEPTVQPIFSVTPQPMMQDIPPVPLQPHPSIPIDSFLSQEPASQRTQVGLGPVELVKTLCCRFHSVARQLRLRGEYRATLSVEDEVDAQDLLHALLRTQFDNIDIDEWTPSYSSGAPRTTLLLNDGRLAVIVKKTRAGLAVKDLTEQLRIDAARYRSHGHCTTLLCFVYDPDGRIGNPRGLEASLTSVNDSFALDILVAPK
jgi:hypothetical protein